MAYEFNRNIKDAAVKVTKAYPAAGANNNSDSINLGGTSAYNQGEGVEVFIDTPALSGFTDSAKKITYKIQESSDDSSFADTGISYEVAGVAVTGVVAETKRFRLPSNVKQYIRINQAETAAGADITGSSSTFGLVF